MCLELSERLPILWMKKWRLREVKPLVQGSQANKEPRRLGPRWSHSRTILPTHGLSLVAKVRLVCPSALLAPFLETSLILILWGWSHVPQRGSFLGHSLPPCPPSPRLHGSEHLPSSQQIRTRIHPQIGQKFHRILAS